MIKTAEILSEIINVNCIPLEGLEEVNLGEWQGLSWEEVKEKYPIEYCQWYCNRRYTEPPNGESYENMLKRVLNAIHKIIKILISISGI
ncbi:MULTISPECIES: histidine phosphatase family protein [Clostridium]|uniref:histidine phosphatase family protein n=1 Tax=Clostridium TaxID=1485 RepID=UPI0029147B86|nr:MULTISPECIES: histidine phosphatase family protein [Clostridium]MDU4479626.1 histidine phosphatase family protein [Clostridium sp.]MDU4847233.1 histidine phosphatase family protein [Clostridium sp.]